MSWLPGQHTGVEDHGGAEGAFTVVTGTSTEQVVPAGRPEVTHRLAAGQSRAFGPDYTHHVGDDGIDPAVSIHVYRPERRCRWRALTVRRGVPRAPVPAPCRPGR